MTATLKIQNCYSWLTGLDDKTRLNFWKALRFRELGYEHNAAYRQKVWDGYRDFFMKESGRFLTGLLPEVLFALKHWEVNYETQDERKLVQFAVEEIDSHFLDPWKPKHLPKNFELYDYQVDLVNQTLKHRRGIISAATGAGKTEYMIAFLKALIPNTPTLILANKKSLVQQNYERLGEWGFKNFGRLYDKYNEPNVITCATVQSLHKIEKLLPHIQVLIVDEIHDMMSKVPKKYYNKLKNCSVRSAVSATWEKFGGKDKCQRYFVKGHFGPVLKTTSDVAEGGVVKTKKLQERGTLSKSLGTFYIIEKPDDIQHDVYIDAVTNGIANNYHLHDIVKNIVQKKCTGRTLILVERLEHGDILNRHIPGSLWVAGEDTLETRKFVIDSLSKANTGNVVGIATQGIFNAGINVKVNNLINAAGGQADHIIIQRMGRGLRTAEDKDILYYYDFVFKINEYLEKHSKKRIRILKKEGHEIEIKKVDELF